MCGGVIMCRIDCQIWESAPEGKEHIDLCPKHKFEITPECWSFEN